MWYQTKVSRLLNIDYPILQGPFGGGISTPELVSTVSNAGGLGGYGAYTLSPQEIHVVDRQIRTLTGKPYQLNLWVSDTDTVVGIATSEQYQKAKERFGVYFDELGIPFPEKPAPFASRFANQLQVILDVRPKMFSFMFGTLPPEILEECRSKGILTAGAATTLDEAIVLESSGVDLIIATGFEAGGHRPSFLDSAEASTTGTFVLVQLIREKVKVPVIAAGGIATGRGIAAAMVLGADAVQVGTAFLATDESGALPIHKEMLFSDAAKYTTLTRAFTGRLGRGLTNRISSGDAGKEPAHLPFPLQTTLMSALRKAAIDRQKWDMMLFWGGQIAPLLTHRKAKHLVNSLVEETTEIFNRLKK
jgi:nitronate monooxygenase